MKNFNRLRVFSAHKPQTQFNRLSEIFLSPSPLAPFYLNTPEKPPLHAKILIKVRRPEWKSKRPTGGKPFPRNLPKQIPNIYNETANLPIRRLLSDPYAIIDTAKTTRLVPIKYKECRSTRINKHPPQPLAQRFTAPMLLFSAQNSMIKNEPRSQKVRFYGFCPRDRRILKAIPARGLSPPPQRKRFDFRLTQ